MDSRREAEQSNEPESARDLSRTILQSPRLQQFPYHNGHGSTDNCRPVLPPNPRLKADLENGAGNWE